MQAKIENTGVVRLSTGFISSGRILCHDCGLRNLCADFAATHCGEFMHTLRFRPPLRGFEGNFNTVRLGKAWAKRVFKGDMVALQNIKTEEIFGYAEVTAVFQGPRELMADLYAGDNHSIKTMGLSPDMQAETLLKRLKNLYGTRAWNNSSEATVIYLTREENPDEYRRLDERGVQA